MPDHIEQLKHAKLQLAFLNQIMPNMALSLDHQLRTYFPGRPANSSTDNLYITYQAPAEQGQAPELISYSLSTLIERSYVSGQVPSYDQGLTQVYNNAFTLDQKDLAQGISIVKIEGFVNYVINNLELCVRNALEHFWKTPLAKLANKNPNDWLYDFVRTLITSEAELRHTDKTLSTQGYAAIKQVLDFTTLQSRFSSGITPPLRVYSVGLKGAITALNIPLQGLLVITDKNASDHANAQAQELGNVVIYSPCSGLEEFDSLQALNQELKARLADVYQREALLDYAPLKDRQRALNLSEVTYREITTDVFTTHIAELINKQSQNMAHTWKTAREQNTQFDLQALASLIQTSLNASISLDPIGILKNRYTRLLESQLPAWLTTAPEDSKQKWRQAVERLKDERLLSQTTDTALVLESGQKSTLLGYARTQLRQQIKSDHQLDVDPDHIFVTTSEALITSPGFYPLSTSGYAAGVSVHRTGPTITYKTTRRSLSELALENVGLLDLNFALSARVLGPDGENHPTLTTAYLKQLVRTLNIGERYKVLLYKTLIDPTAAQVKWRKERYTAVTTAQLRLDILEAKLAGHLTPQEITWLETVLSHPTESTRPAVSGNAIRVHLLTLREKPMPGLLAITAAASHILCYTPNAPDKIWFRRAQSLDELAIVLSREALHSYLIQRVSSATRPYIKVSLKRGLKSNIGLQVLTSDYLQTAYEEEARFAIRNADEQSTSTFEANVQTAKEVALTALDIISFALPTKILLPLVLARFIYSAAEGLDALQRDERDEALFHFLDSVSHLADGASDFAGSAVFGRSIRQRVKVTTPALNPEAATAIPKTDMRLRKNDAYGSGIYEYIETRSGKPRYYLEDDQGNLYRSHYDNLNETWRIIDERQPDAIYTLPVSQVSAGRWSTASATHAATLSMHELVEKASVNIDLSAHTPDAKGVYTVNNLHYIQQNGVAFEVQFGWLGRNLYLQVPGASHTPQNTYKLRRHEPQGDWQVKRQQSDNTPLWEPLTLNPNRQTPILPDSAKPPFSDYDAQLKYISDLKQMTATKGADFQHYVYMINSKLEAARFHIAQLQRRMFEDALAFFKTFTPAPRSALPDIPAQASQQNILKTLYEQYPGVVIGEAHFHTSSKKIIIDNMAFLAKNDVKVLYMEHLQTDLHQSYLDSFFETGEMHPELAQFLKAQDLGHQVSKYSRYTFTRLVQESQRHGIRVKALDCIATYNIKGLSSSETKSPRHEMLSYGASQIIRKHTPQASGQKWIALTGNSHANTYKGVPGLAEIEGAVGLRVQDVTPGTSQGIRPDTGFIDIPVFRIYDYSLLKNDLVLDIEIPGTPIGLKARALAELEIKLPTAGMYTFEKISPRGPLLVHRSRSGELLQTPFGFDDDGKFYIDRPGWQGIHLKRYEDLNILINDLKTFLVRQVP